MDRPSLTIGEKSFGGRLFSEGLKPSNFIIVLYDPDACDPTQLDALVRHPGFRCLKWDWVVACHEAGRLLMDDGNNWAGHLSTSSLGDIVSPLTATVSRASSDATAVSTSANLRTPNISPCPDLSAAQRTLLPTKKLVSKLGRPAQDAMSSATVKQPQPRTKRQWAGEIEEGETSSSASSSKRPRPAPSKEGTVSSYRAPSPSVIAALEPPSPPKTITKSEWFGYDFTDADDHCTRIISYPPFSHAELRSPLDQFWLYISTITARSMRTQTSIRCFRRSRTRYVNIRPAIKRVIHVYCTTRLRITKPRCGKITSTSMSRNTRPR